MRAAQRALGAAAIALWVYAGYTVLWGTEFYVTPYETRMGLEAQPVSVQQLTEVKLNAGIPAYADIIVRAIKDGCLETDREVFLAPVGKGSLAINNTAKGFEERFARRIAMSLSG